MASRMKAWRKREGLSLREESGLTGVSVAMLSMAENGLREMSPQLKVLVSRRLHVPIHELFDVEEISANLLCVK